MSGPSAKFPSRGPFLAPGTAHPHPPLAAEDLAERLSVSTPEVLSWLKEGLPAQGGLIDPFAAANWLCWGRLERCPLLARRWQAYLRWFAPHVHGQDAPARYRVTQDHRLYLPHAVPGLSWYVPRIPVCQDQPEARVVERLSPRASGSPETTTVGPFERFTWSEPIAAPRVVGETEVLVTPRPLDLFPDHRMLVELVAALANEFRYEYRHHLPAEDPRDPLPIGRDGISGSCLDCALELGRRLDELGRPWRLCTGIIANSVVANPHFWLKVDTTIGWVPVDPSLPAIARMLGADWMAYVDAYVGGCDARRITLAEGTLHLPMIPGGATVGSSIGEAIADAPDDAAGKPGVAKLNAWACIDWVCGDCSWSFAESRE